MSAEVAPQGTIEVLALPPSGIGARTRASGWGYLPELSLLGAVGLLMVAVGYTRSRASEGWGEPLFWWGLVLIFAPIVIRLFVIQTLERRERLGLLLVLQVLLYFVTVLQYPLTFSGFDEFAHWRTAQDISATGHLFQDNSLLTISPIYPGLEMVTNAVSDLTGLSLTLSGRIVVGVAHLLLVLALYLLFERVTGSARLAGIATALYMTNPHYLFFDAQYAYESIALPMAVFVLFVAARAVHLGDTLRTRLGFIIAAIVGVWTVVVMHHLTSYALMGFLLLWMLASLLRSRRTWDSVSLGIFVLLGMASVAFWLVYTQSRALAYLTPVVAGAVHQLQLILAGEAATRQLFHDYGGGVTPLWQRVFATGSVGLILVGIVPGIFWIWRNRVNAAVLALAIWALLYIPSQALRLSQAGVEVADRATEFVFLGLATVLAIGMTQVKPDILNRRVAIRALTMFTTVLFIGGIIAGSGPDWERLPGPFLVSADSRSLTQEGVSASQWASVNLGSGHRVATDRVNSLLMATYGRQRVITSLDDNIDPSPLFTSLTFDDTDLSILRQTQIQYLVADLRLSTELPRRGFYFSEIEPGAFNYTAPISKAALTKYDNLPNVNRVFDSGNIVIYDTGALLNGT
ncbi:MAG TPA: hypothetical protein VFW17_18780 [Ktedonobacterales bacterium]|nr:hypothetical protein [Ktedonobacterales bacterium]